MLRMRTAAGALALAFTVALAAPVAAQERGEEILGHVTRVDGRTLIVTQESGRQVRITVTPSTEVYFSDSGDRRLFPNPTIGDLRAGMGVRFVYGTGTPDRITVHFVPEGQAGAGGGGTTASSEQLKARIQTMDRLGRRLTADVAGSSRSFDIENRAARGFRAGDLVVLTVENRDGRSVVTRIDSASMTGIVRRIGNRSRAVSIEVEGREDTFDVDDSDVLDGVREGDRVRFEVEERGDRRVVTAIRRAGLRDRD